MRIVIILANRFVFAKVSSIQRVKCWSGGYRISGKGVHMYKGGGGGGGGVRFADLI